MKSITRAIALLSVTIFPTLALAATTIVGGTSGGSSFFGISFGGNWSVGGCASTICGIANTILYLINNVLVPVLFAVAFIFFLYGIAKAYIFSQGEPEKVSEGHRLVLWGIIAFAIMISIWGLVNIVANTFGLNGSYIPEFPRSY
ncbi:hypothetical protein COU19_01195 [Candidatus Kaiserbacteria bacterium CG10_big_fil_rev_8_21_14_0_10_56_12]|uniref:Uncharacterized protein n=1 Tax=Candidatus Kaiserbacteria bacterium CG10_big_fil_rev_8_21_14_0_10_56_12 TaxID=1974611 RepID=A0A2H0UAF7_9BACT|nr:MAG: hypothetical protein COU19_01195 [Candidatus Kaiserbacteria bacterium CG10_big_fil_rev_8_21_14_0_10_56_12]